MLKKTITYEDYNGESVTEDFYFNLTKAELVELEVSDEHGFADSLLEIVKSNDGKTIIDTFKRIILMAYGKKSEDGRRFIKNEQLREEFSQTEAYSDLFIELSTDAGAAAAFVNSVIPQAMAQNPDQLVLEASEAIRKVEDVPLPEPVEEMPEGMGVVSEDFTEPRTVEDVPSIGQGELTQEQLESLDKEQLIAYFQGRPQG